MKKEMWKEKKKKRWKMFIESNINLHSMNPEHILSILGLFCCYEESSSASAIETTERDAYSNSGWLEHGALDICWFEYIGIFNANEQILLILCTSSRCQVMFEILSVVFIFCIQFK